MKISMGIICTALLVLVFGSASLAAPGDTVLTIPSPADCPHGLTFDGTHLWNVDRKSDQIYRVDPASGEKTDSIPSPGYTPLGLTWDGKLLWCIDKEEQAIYGIDPVSRIVERTLYCPVSRPGGLAFDGRHLWISDDGDDKILQISTEDGTTIKSIPSPTGRPGGLTFDGTYLWVADRFQDRIYMVTADHGDVIITFASPGPHPWGLAWDGEYLWNVDYETDRISKLVVDDGTPFVRFDEKVQQVEYIHQVRNFGPDSLKTLNVYLAIPHDLNSQELLEEIRFVPEPNMITDDKWGQKVAAFEFRDLGPAEFTDVRMYVKARLYKTRYFVYPDKVGKLGDIPEDIRRLYLSDDTKYSMDDPVIQKAVAAAVGDETNPYWIGRKIYNYVIEHMEYELAGGWNIAPAVLDRGNGSCSEYSFVYISMCRASGLPARFAGSVVIRGDDASYDDVYHRWVEIYLPNFGWMPVDPSGGDSPWPSSRANYFGFLNNRFLITTTGGGGSEFLEWGYNANERWTSRGRCKVVVEAFAEWEPATE